MKRIAAAAVLLVLVAVILFVAGQFVGNPDRGANDPRAIENEPVDPDHAARTGTALEGSPRAPDPRTPPAPDAAPTMGPASAAAPARVTVTVLGPGKAPIAGARVQLVVPGGSTRWDAVSDAAGKARFDAVPVPDVWIWTWATGFLPADAYFTPTLDNLKGGEERAAAVHLVAGATIEGRVIDARTHEGLAGVPVRTSSSQDVPPTALSDAQGHFRLVGLPWNESITLWAELEGRSRGETSVELHPNSPAAAPTILALDRAGWIVAQVRGPDGDPLPHADAMAWPMPAATGPGTAPDYGAPWGSLRRLESTCDAQGKARLPGLPLDVPYCVMALRRDFARSVVTTGVVATSARPDVEVALSDLCREPRLALDRLPLANQDVHRQRSATRDAHPAPRRRAPRRAVRDGGTAAGGDAASRGSSPSTGSRGSGGGVRDRGGDRRRGRVAREASRGPLRPRGGLAGSGRQGARPG
jgi:hypothetical protein